MALLLTPRASAGCSGSRSGGGSQSTDSEFADFAPEETLIFFEWEDVLMPTTWLESKGLLKSVVEPRREVRAELRELQRAAGALLEEAKRRGRVVIVTREVDPAVVSLTCRRFTPGLAPTLAGVRVVAAGDPAKPRDAAALCDRKARLLRHEVQRFFRALAPGSPRNVLSFEAEASRSAAKEAFARDRRVLCKRQLFPAEPMGARLRGALEQVDFYWLLRCNGNLDSAPAHWEE